MQTPETRIINQCTYTPIELSKDDTPSAQPFVFQAILANAFDEHELTKAVLERMELARKPDLPDPPYERLVTAVKAMWAGDLETSITTLSKVNRKQVEQFVRKALEVERKALEQSHKDLTDAVATVVKRTEAEVDRKTELSREMAVMRESIMADIRNMIATPRADVVRSNISSPESATMASAVMKMAPISVVSQAKPERDSMTKAITADMIRAEMTERLPQSVDFLNKIGFFTSSMTLVSSPMPSQLLSVKLAHNELKAQTVEDLLKNTQIEPIGYLHLERLQFTPVRYEKGELVYSLPMLPGETVRLTHREWSRTETEYTKLVATEMETATEEAISEKSELAQSSNTQQQHSSAFNTSVNSSYSGGGFSISASFGYNCNDSETSSRQVASKQAQEITKKATSRAKKDSKITFKVATAYELEDQQYREISNPLKRAVRYDFHRLMKKWRVDLYRYDIRLTYDIVIPEPGSYLLRKYVLLEAINDELAKPNPFQLSPASIDPELGGPTSWQSLSDRYDVSLDPSPEAFYYTTAKKTVTFSKSQGERDYLEITLPPEYEFYSWKGNDGFYFVNIFDNNGQPVGWKGGKLDAMQSDNANRLNAGAKHSNHIEWMYFCDWGYEGTSLVPEEGASMTISVDVCGKLTERALREWQMQCYERLSDAAKLQYENKQVRLKQIRDELLQELNREDALMLRKIEREEIMKGVLRWLFGPKFRFYPENQAGLQLPNLTLPKVDLENLDVAALEDVASEYYDPTTSSVKEAYHTSTLQYGNLIKFLHQAIEWENINYVLYPYFWTKPDKARWDFKQSLYHNDYIHRSFLRAGAARVVLTIRPGFVKPFLSLMKGQFQGELPEGDIYLSVADELEAAARTNYPYTQDANVEKEEYMFTWEHIGENQGNEQEESWLARCLRQSFYVEWAEGHVFTGADNQPVEIKPKFEKSADQNIITVSIFHAREPGEPPNAKIEGSVQMQLVKKDGEAVNVALKISDGKSYDLKVRKEGNLHKVYREQNLVDTWYEFTPTGALDVEVGNISPVLDNDEG